MQKHPELNAKCVFLCWYFIRIQRQEATILEASVLRIELGWVLVHYTAVVYGGCREYYDFSSLNLFRISSFRSLVGTKPATIYIHRGPGHKLVRKQKHDGLRHLLWLPSSRNGIPGAHFGKLRVSLL